MKKISDCLSPVGWLIMAFAGYLPMLLILHPSWGDLGLLVIVDTIAGILTAIFESRTFVKLFPDTAPYFKGIQKMRTPDERAKTLLLESLFQFPRRRASFCFLVAFLKVTPGVLVAVFVWQHQVSNLVQAMLMLAVALLNFCYFYGAVFLESHHAATRLIGELHERFDFSEAFSQVRLRYSKRDFEIQEAVSLVFIFVFTLSLQFSMLVTGSGSRLALAVKAGAIGIVGLFLFSWVFYLGRRYVVGGIEQLFSHMDEVDYRKAGVIVPLHSSPLLARFERSFNLLGQRLRRSEQELTALVLHEADRSRYQALGEFSALVAHDLSGPLHVAHYCARHLVDAPNADNTRHVAHLNDNLARAIDLITSLKARLKDSPSDGGAVTFSEAHRHVLRLLETQWNATTFASVRVTVDPRLETVPLGISRVDLIHVLDNLYRNSFSNLIASATPAPHLAVTLHDADGAQAEIHVLDNGSGLTSDEFERMTAFAFTTAGAASPRRRSMGLRLTRRLIELSGGSLRVAAGTTSGTQFILRLPAAAEGIPTGLKTDDDDKNDAQLQAR